MKPHKHAELIKAWADGAEIQHQHSLSGTWFDCEGDPKWEPYVIYRIKPQPKRDTHLFCLATKNHGIHISTKIYEHNLILIFDGETDKLKSAEVL